MRTRGHGDTGTRGYGEFFAAGGDAKSASPPAAKMSPCLLFALALLLAGCQPTPRAPDLEDSPFFASDQEGVRFLVPEGWTLFKKSAQPPGKVRFLTLIVAYHQLRADKPGEFELYRVDLPASADVTAHLQEHLPNAAKWELRPNETLQLGGIPATRLNFYRKERQHELARSVTYCRRGERVYVFVAARKFSDHDSRDQIDRALESVTWQK